jgi:hypothetical protein
MIFSEISKIASGKMYTGSSLVVLEFTQAVHLGIYPAVCASKRSNDQAFTTAPNVSFWHRTDLHFERSWLKTQPTREALNCRRSHSGKVFAVLDLVK